MITSSLSDVFWPSLSACRSWLPDRSAVRHIPLVAPIHLGHAAASARRRSKYGVAALWRSGFASRVLPRCTVSSLSGSPLPVRRCWPPLLRQPRRTLLAAPSCNGFPRYRTTSSKCWLRRFGYGRALLRRPLIGSSCTACACTGCCGASPGGAAGAAAGAAAFN